MNLPTDFPELEALREKMGAPFRRFEAQIDIKLKKGGVTIHPDEYVIVDEIPTVQNLKVALYLQDAWTYQIKYNDFPKYHVIQCRTLQDMRKYGQYDRYYATRRTDGDFLVKLSASDELSPLKLNLCKNCLDKLKEQYGSDVFPTEPGEFPLADWFEIFDDNEGLDQAESPHVGFDYLSAAWQARSLVCRENANWTCEQCQIDLKNNRYFLHAHHKWGTRYNASGDLVALCIRCHAEQLGHGHETLKYNPAYQEFMQKYGNISRPSREFNLSRQQPSSVQGQSIPTYIQTGTTEEDIPF